MESLLSTDVGLLLTFLYGVYRHFAGGKTDRIEARVKEVARAAFDLTRAYVDAGHMDVLVMRDRARERAHTMLLGIGLSPKGRIGQLVDHELDVLAAALARDHLDDQLKYERSLAHLAKMAQTVPQEMKDAEARGRDRMDFWDDKTKVASGELSSDEDTKP